MGRLIDKQLEFVVGSLLQCPEGTLLAAYVVRDMLQPIDRAVSWFSLRLPGQSRFQVVKEQVEVADSFLVLLALFIVLMQGWAVR